MDNNLNNNIEINNKVELESQQKNFLETTLGKTINTGIDIGIRAVLPDYIEDQIIDLKDNLIKYGLKDGIKKSIDDAINLGKSAIGIVSGNFENISQMQEAIKSGGIIDNVSGLLHTVINKVQSNGLINSTVARTIQNLHNLIKNNGQDFNLTQEQIELAKKLQ